MDIRFRVVTLAVFVVVYIYGRSIHGDQPGRSHIFQAPRWLAGICGQPLQDGRLEFAPMVVQLSGIVGATAAGFMLLNILGERVGAAVILLDVFVGCTVILLNAATRGSRD